jgi:hypothetical protein
MKPLHNSLSQIIKDIEKIEIKNLASLAVNNILFSLLSTNYMKYKKQSDEELENTYNYSESDSEHFSESIVSDHEPYLPPMSSSHVYTLVLDLDETLIHYFNVIIFVTSILDTNFRNVSSQALRI